MDIKFISRRMFLLTEVTGRHAKVLVYNDDEDKKVTEALKKLKKSDKDADIKLRDYMCRNFYDIRAFGAVMTTFVKASYKIWHVKASG